MLGAQYGSNTRLLNEKWFKKKPPAKEVVHKKHLFSRISIAPRKLT